jgi:demethylmenaquinone methyltransferase/2-methoxy-6-polyprenyl-1,4-benzoquinol methylase
MAHLKGTERAAYVQGMFARIASHYDVMNRLMTFGQDRYWRREVIKRADLPPSASLLLDLGCGTGDLGLDAVNSNPKTVPIEADFTLEMMHSGRERPGTEVLHWSAADALNLPFPNHSFDAVVSGFLLRNVVDLPKALGEQYRVIKPGGRIVTLDTTKPQKNLLTPFVRFYMHAIIPFLGRLISGQADAYVYLPDSSEGFLSAEELVAQMITAGFDEIGFERKNFGTIAIHWGEK